MSSAPEIICIGSVLWDVIGRSGSPMEYGQDVPGRISRLPGGVAMNVAMTLRRFDLSPALLSCLGQDAEGSELLSACADLGLNTEFIHIDPDLPTDVYMAIEAQNGLVGAIADAHSLETAGDKILAPLLDGRLGSDARPFSGQVVIDGNLTTKLLGQIATAPCFRAADFRLAPASPGKAERLSQMMVHKGAVLYVNLIEAGLLCNAEFEKSDAAAKALIRRGAARVLVTDGANTICDACADHYHVTDPPVVRQRRITGAGDTFMAAHIAAERRGDARQAALEFAATTAANYVHWKENQ